MFVCVRMSFRTSSIHTSIIDVQNDPKKSKYKERKRERKGDEDGSQLTAAVHLAIV